MGRTARRYRISAALIGLAVLAGLAVVGLAQTGRPDPELVKHMRAGLQARKEQRWNDAAREFEAAIRMSPNLAEAYANLGLVRNQQGNMAAAAAAFEKALELKPGLPGLRGFLGYSYLMSGRAEAAVGVLERAAREMPSDMRTQSYLGIAYLEAGRYEDAIAQLSKVRQSQPEDINLLLYLTKAYESRMGELNDELYRLSPAKAREVDPVIKSRSVEGETGAGDTARIAKLEVARKANPRDIDALAELSLAYKGVVDGLRARIFKLDPEKARAAFENESAAAAGLESGPKRDVPLSSSQREKLVRNSCSQCHRFPPPSILPKRAWAGKAEKMFSLANVALLPKKNRPIRDVRLDEVVAFYETLAPEDLKTPPWGPAEKHGSVRFERHSMVGVAPGNEIPGSGNVKLAELFDDVKGPELIVCDMFSGWVSWTDPDNPKPALEGLARLVAPDHAEVVDLDGDGQKDLLVAELGQVIPSDKKLGAVTMLRRTGPRDFEVIRLARNLGRVADAEAADFDGDGDLDVVAAVFGWITVGRILYLENQTPAGAPPRFVQRTIDDRIGSIHVPVVDLNKDGKADFIALISQQHETIVAFLGRGDGQFDRQEIFTAPHPHWGFSGIEPIDFDGDGDLDVLYTNGDTMDDMIRFKPHQGVAWLENKGAYPFELHRISRHYGAMRAEAGDLDGDGDLDVAVSVWLPMLTEVERAKYNLPGVAWYERLDDGSFVPHTISAEGCDRPTLDIGDVDGDGLLDVVTGTAWLGEPEAGAKPVAVDIWRQTRVKEPD